LIRYYFPSNCRFAADFVDEEVGVVGDEDVDENDFVLGNGNNFFFCCFPL